MRWEHDSEDGVALTVGMRREADIIVRSQAAMIDVVHNVCKLCPTISIALCSKFDS